MFINSKKSNSAKSPLKSVLLGSVVCISLSTGMSEAGQVTKKFFPTLKPGKSGKFEVEVYSTRKIRCSVDGAQKTDIQFWGYKNSDGSLMGPNTHSNTSARKQNTYNWARRGGAYTINRGTKNSYTKIKLFFRDHEGNFKTIAKENNS